MRGLVHSDLVMLARRLLGLPEATWEGTVRQMLDRAHTADLYRKRTGRATHNPVNRARHRQLCAPLGKSGPHGYRGYVCKSGDSCVLPTIRRRVP